MNPEEIELRWLIHNNANKFIERLSNSSLITFDLSSNKLLSDHAKYIAAASIKYPTFVGYSKDFIGSMLYNPGLYNIWYPTKVGYYDDHIKLKNNSLLKSIYLHHNKIGPLGAGYIAEASIKYSTFVEYSKDFIGSMLYNPGLYNIWYPTKVGYYDDHIKLKDNLSLVLIDLYDNNITEVGAGHIAEALKVNSSIVALDLLFNNIKVIGAGHIADASIKYLTFVGYSKDFIGSTII